MLTELLINARQLVSGATMSFTGFHRLYSRCWPGFLVLTCLHQRLFGGILAGWRVGVDAFEHAGGLADFDEVVVWVA
jgi:hypothetical protein